MFLVELMCSGIKSAARWIETLTSAPHGEVFEMSDADAKRLSKGLVESYEEGIDYEFILI